MKKLYDLIVGFLAVLGIIFFAAMLGLVWAGFFHWLTLKYPNEALLKFLFGG